MKGILPLRKQCQTVGGQEWHHPRSSSSDSEDIQKMPDSDSLLVYGENKTRVKVLNQRLQKRRYKCLSTVFFGKGGSLGVSCLLPNHAGIFPQVSVIVHLLSGMS